MKNKKIIIIVIFIIFGIATFILYFPVEYSIKLENTSSEKYIIVKYSEGTESFWSIIGNEKGFFQNKAY